jgi:polyisoprenoid-binding protein YceI
MTASIEGLNAGARARLTSGDLAGTWTLDPARSSMTLQTRTLWGLVKVKGRFSRVAGVAMVSAGGDISGSLTVEATSIDTGHHKRDEHLRSADFFTVDTYPHFAFSAERVDWSGPTPMVEGSLQVRDCTRTLQVPVQVSTSGADVVELTAEVVLNRADYGMDWNRMGAAKMVITLHIQAVFTRSPRD